MPQKDRLHEHYDRKYAEEVGRADKEVCALTAFPTNRFEAAVKALKEIFPGGDILELAAGSGNLADSLEHHGLDFRSYTLTDFSEARVQGMQGRFTDPRFRVLPLDAEKADEASLGRFDAIIMVALIEHLIDPLGAMCRLSSLLKPGGFVYIDTPNIAKITRRIKLLLGRFPSTASMNEGLTTHDGHPVDLYDEGHLHYFTYRSLSEMLVRRCGFKRVTKLGYSSGRKMFGPRIDNLLARNMPELFSEVALAAYV